MSVLSQKPVFRRELLPVFVAGIVVLAIPAVLLNLRFFQQGGFRSQVRTGIGHFQARRYDQAILSWQEALRADPTDPEPYQLLANAYLQLGAPDQALPLLRRLTELAPRTPELYSQIAEAVALTGDGDALGAAKQAVEKEPGSARAHALLGIQYGDRQDHVASVGELSKAHLLSPDDNKVEASLAQAQLNAADLDGAEKTSRNILARDRDYATAWFVLGWSYSRRTPTPENVREGIAAFAQTVRLRPKEAVAHAELGRLQLIAGDLPAATRSLEAAWRMGPQTDQVAFQLAEAYRRAGQTQKAQQMQATFARLHSAVTRRDALKKRLSVDPNDLDARLELGVLELDAGNLNEAGGYLQRVVQARPDDPQALAAAVRFFTQAGDAQRARAFQERLIKGRKR
jgi:Flp pilus assembly protein TadD